LAASSSACLRSASMRAACEQQEGERVCVF
jgi:hypothetical protein